MSSVDLAGSKNSKTPIKPFDIHIVVDNSNVFIGARLGQGEDQQQDASVRINVGNLVSVIERDNKASDIRTRLVGGSTPPRTSRVWDEWEKYQYRCLLGDRSKWNKEVFLDDMLHSQIQKLILTNEHRLQSIQQKLILLSGDGNDNSGRTSFPGVVLIALQHGWFVEIWSWKTSTSTKYRDLQGKYPSLMKIKHFDTFRNEITFKQRQSQTTPKQKSIDRFWILFFCFIAICSYFIIYH